MNYNNILAAKVDLDIDYNRIEQEILACKDIWVYTPPKYFQITDGLEKGVWLVTDKENYLDVDYTALEPNRDWKNKSDYDEGLSIVKRKLRGPDICYLTKHKESVHEAEAYRISKRRNLDGWEWRDDIYDRIPYFRQVTESIFSKVGLIRIFIMEDTFLMTHRDYVSDNDRETGYYDDNYYSKDFDRCLGLSLIPNTGNVPMKIWSRLENKIIDVPGNAMIFNDSVFHGVPMTTGRRITIRIFGELDYSQFDDKLDKNNLHFLERE